VIAFYVPAGKVPQVRPKSAIVLAMLSGGRRYRWADVAAPFPEMGDDSHNDSDDHRKGANKR
jgi:hypothetical protein